MDYQIYILLAPLAAIFNLLSIGISLQFIKEKISKILLKFQISTLLFLILNYLEFVSNDLETMLILSKLEHLSLQLISLFWFDFAIFYTGNGKIVKKKFFIIITTIICLNMTLIFTNNFHHLFYTSVEKISKGQFSYLNAQYGFHFWIISAFDYSLIIAGVAFILLSYIKGVSFHQAQAKFIILGFLFPLFVNIVYIFRLIPGFNKDFSPVTFSLTGIFIFIGIYRFRLLHYTPISRNTVLENIKDAIVTLDLEYRIVDYNIKACEIFNLTEKHLGTKVDDGVIGSVLGSISHYFTDKENVNYTKKINFSTYNLNIKKIYNSDNVLGIVISLSDISDKMKLIEELNKSTKLIQNMQNNLVRSERMAALGKLTAEVSHEINNPLTFIKSNFSVLERYLNNNITDNDIKDLVTETKSGIQRITDVIHNMLDYSREESNTEANIFNINRSIESTLGIAEGVINSKATLDLNLSYVPDLKVNGSKIDQVILNLLVNSAQAIDENRSDGIITVKTWYELDIIFCEISDNGLQINKSDRELIFEPFYTTKQNTGGTGLGLGLSRNIIEKDFSGKLFLKDSKLTTFRIELPTKK